MNLPFWISQTFHEIPNSIKTVVFFFLYIFFNNVVQKKNPFILRLFILFTCLFLHFDFLVSKISKLTSGFSQKTLFICIFYIPVVVFILVYSHQGKIYMLCNRRTKKNMFFFCWFDFLNWQKYYRWIIFFLK